MNVNRPLGVVLLTLLACNITTSNARSGELRIRNRSRSTIYVAVAYHWHYVPSENGDDARVSGYHAIGAGETRTLASYPRSRDYGGTKLSMAYLHINEAGRIWHPRDRHQLVMDRSTLKRVSNSQASWWIVQPRVNAGPRPRFNIDPSHPVFQTLRQNGRLHFYKTNLSGSGVVTFTWR